MIGVLRADWAGYALRIGACKSDLASLKFSDGVEFKVTLSLSPILDGDPLELLPFLLSPSTESIKDVGSDVNVALLFLPLAIKADDCIKLLLSIGGSCKIISEGWTERGIERGITHILCFIDDGIVSGPGTPPSPPGRSLD
jgi:hypothetical protein